MQNHNHILQLTVHVFVFVTGIVTSEISYFFLYVKYMNPYFL